MTGILRRRGEYIETKDKSYMTGGSDQSDISMSHGMSRIASDP